MFLYFQFVPRAEPRSAAAAGRLWETEARGDRQDSQVEGTHVSVTITATVPKQSWKGNGQPTGSFEKREKRSQRHVLRSQERQPLLLRVQNWLRHGKNTWQGGKVALGKPQARVSAFLQPTSPSDPFAHIRHYDTAHTPLPANCSFSLIFISEMVPTLAF